MPDDFLPKEEAVEHTAESGGAAQSRVEQLLEQFGTTLSGLADNTSKIADHLAELKIQQAAEAVPATARVGVNDAVDTAGAAGNVGAKAVDVPLAASEDVIHDAGETITEAKKEVAQARKLKFKRRR